MASPHEISHVEVRRHPIWQREVRYQVAHPHAVASAHDARTPRGRLVLGMLVVVALLGAAVAWLAAR